MSLWTSFAFLDESGTLAFDPSQRFFAIGMLLVESTARFHESLMAVHSQAIVELMRGRPSKLPKLRGRDFEFKFANITNSHIRYYQRLIDDCLRQPSLKARILVIDKSDPVAGRVLATRGTWDSYLTYAAKMIDEFIPPSDKCIVIADYITKPRDHPLHIEHKLRADPKVLNATMLESDASLFIQAIDVLTGCVLYHLKNERIAGFKPNKAKLALADHLAHKLGVAKFTSSTSTLLPMDFSVLEAEK